MLPLRWLTAECCVEVRCALRCAASAAAVAAGGASVHSPQCCDVRSLYLSPGLFRFSSHLIPFARPPRNKFIKRGDLRAGGRSNSLHGASFGPEVSSLFIWFDCNNNRPISLSVFCTLFVSVFPALGGYVMVSLRDKTREEKKGVENFWSLVISR